MHVEALVRGGRNSVIAVPDAIPPHTFRSGFMYFVCLNDQSLCNWTPHLDVTLHNSNYTNAFYQRPRLSTFPRKISAVP